MELALLGNLTEGLATWGQEDRQDSTLSTTQGMDSSTLLKAPLVLGIHHLVHHKVVRTVVSNQEGGQHRH